VTEHVVPVTVVAVDAGYPFTGTRDPLPLPHCPDLPMPTTTPEPGPAVEPQITIDPSQARAPSYVYGRARSELTTTTRYHLTVKRIIVNAALTPDAGAGRIYPAPVDYLHDGRTEPFCCPGDCLRIAPSTPPCRRRDDPDCVVDA